ncbi:MAG: hypothetical protein M1376_24350 [Planctomycetes bacterium]|nr:hypothetical protein [Planctomycetota bacterium]
MTNPAHEDLVELLRRFMDEPAARAAHEDIQTGERLLETHPAPAPDARRVTAIKTQMAVVALRRHRTVRLVRGSLAAAAAVIVLALIGLLGPRSTDRPRLSYAAIIPTAIWDSHDLTADDLDLAYFSAEIGRIEAQMQALDAGDSESGSGAPDEFENELMAIQTDFWKG